MWSSVNTSIPEAILTASLAISLALIPLLWRVMAIAAAWAKLPPEPIATTSSSGSSTYPLPEIHNKSSSLKAITIACNLAKVGSLRQLCAISTAALRKSPE